MRVAVVGGIATGKSVVMEMFESLGAKTVYADRLNRELLENKEYVDVIATNFENVVFDGKIDRVSLRNLIINNDELRLRLNSIAHPRIVDRIATLTNSDELYFVEIPLFSTVANIIKFDKICVVTAPDELRENRIMIRDRVSLEDARKIINSQKSERNVISFADFVIVNDGDLDNLRTQVTNVLEQCLIG